MSDENDKGASGALIVLDDCSDASNWQVHATEGVAALVEVVGDVGRKSLRLDYDFNGRAGFALVRKKVGKRLASLSDPRAPGRASWANHLRAVLAAPRELLDNHPRRAELMVDMLQRSLKWIRANKPADIVAKLGIQDPELARDLADPMKRMPDLYSPDGRFKAAEVEATRAFLRATGTPLPAGVDIHSLIADVWVKR